jgi:surface protein
MFNGGNKLTSIPPLNTSNVTSMSNMFNGCTKLTSIPQLDTSNVTTMVGMFLKCSALTSIPQLDTSNVTNMQSMFSECIKLPLIDIPHYNLPSTSNSTSMFYNCNSLKAVIIRSFGTNYALNSNAFNNCYHILGTVNATYNPNGDKDGYIYVPKNMIETLSSATNWSAYADQIRALEDYTVDGTTTGELDESKI